MPDSIQISKVVRFEAFELNLKTGELRKGGVKIRLQEQSYPILAALLERPGKPAPGSGSGACRRRTENTGEIRVFRNALSRLPARKIVLLPAISG